MTEVAALRGASPPVGPPPPESLARLALGSLTSGSGRANSAPQSVFQYLPAGLEQVGWEAAARGPGWGF